MAKALDYLLEKFPVHRARIVVLYKEDEDFRIICEDYFTSAQALEDCRINSMKDKEVEIEYSKVYLELEREINHLLRNGKT